MTEIEFRRLSEDLHLLAKSIPLNWGAIQNNKYDHLLNMFSIDTYSELESSLVKFYEPIQVYFKRRWYLWKCAQCDEYLFYKNQNVEKNPNPRDQSYDICIDGVYYFDIKGTVIPKSMRNQNIDNIIDSPQEMVDFYYDKQSRGVRNCYQNRLFVVHHSFVDPAREFYLRCAWGTKAKAYEYISNHISEIDFTQYKERCDAIVVFLIEREKGKIEWKISGLKMS